MGSKVRQWYLLIVGFCIAALLASWHVAFGQKPSSEAPSAKVDQSVRDYANGMLAEGMRTFRFDTFGSEEFWGGKLKLHHAIEGEKNGGTGPGLSPKKALELGLKVDMDAVPEKVAASSVGHRAYNSKLRHQMDSVTNAMRALTCAAVLEMQRGAI